MKNVHSVTRPAWALDWVESWAGLLAAIALSTAAITSLDNWLDSKLGSNAMTGKLDMTVRNLIVDGLLTIFLFLLCHIAIKFYKWYKTSHYPGSYLYCFRRTDPVTSVKTDVAGFFILKCVPNGSMFAYGTSFDLHDGVLDLVSRVRWVSENVSATERQGEVTCYILYEVDHEDWGRRPYRHGLISFKSEDAVGMIARGPAYYGNMQAIDPPTAKIAVYANAYAEYVGKKKGEDELRAKLSEWGKQILDRL
jgi:hypothetical protein